MKEKERQKGKEKIFQLRISEPFTTLFQNQSKKSW
jgi:hypothetical protein